MPNAYSLPTFEAWAMPLRNALLERLPVSFSFGKDVPAVLEVFPRASAFAPVAELALAIDGHPWRAYLENRALLPLHPLFAEEALQKIEPESLPEPLLGLVAEALCGAFAKGFSALTGAVVKALDYQNSNGATVSAQHFEALWQALQSPMKKGETSPVVVADIPEFSPEEGIGE